MRAKFGKITFCSGYGDYVGAAISQPLGAGAANTASGTRYEGNLSIKRR